MPIRFTIDHDKRQGEVTLDDVQAFLDATVVQNDPLSQALRRPRFRPHFDDDDAMMLGARLSAYAGNLGTRGALAFVAPSEEAAVVLAKRVLNLGKSSDRGASAPHHAHERAWRPAVPKSMSALPAMTF